VKVGARRHPVKADNAPAQVCFAREHGMLSYCFSGIAALFLLLDIIAPVSIGQ
jgi:hypothetical protein